MTFDLPGQSGNQTVFVARIEDQERRVAALLETLESVVGLASGLPGSDRRLALLGHFMAGDVLMVFFLLDGLIGGWVYRRTWHPLVGALGIGLLFAWAIAVSSPVVS